MKESGPTQARFLADVSGHQMTTLRDDGLYRHIRFARPDTSVMRFDLITWPGFLCYTGDMGCYVFSRVADMFTFFRGKPGDLDGNPAYWAEKACAVDSCDGLKEFSEELFRAAVKESFDDWVYDLTEDGQMEAEEQGDLWGRVERDVFGALGCGGQNDAYRAAMDFEHRDERPFQDFWERRCEVFTYRYLWCCFALVWGIQQYDEEALRNEREP